MIKIDKENFKIETNCKTVGEFMTEAAAFGLSVKISINDNNNYFFEGGQKVKVVDDTPIDKVLFDRTDYTFNARASFRVFTKPKPKTVRKSGWVIICDCYDDCKQRFLDNRIFPTKELAIAQKKYNTVAVAKIEWEEVQE